MNVRENTLELLSVFDLPEDHIGVVQLIRALEILAEDPAEIHAVRKGIYMAIADEYACTWKAVESNLRRLIDRVWEQEPERLSTIAGRTLRKRPSVAQFLQMISRYLLWQDGASGQ